jgi:hypothetical protein
MGAAVNLRANPKYQIQKSEINVTNGKLHPRSPG